MSKNRENSNDKYSAHIPYYFTAEQVVKMSTINSILTFVTFDCLAASNWPPGHPRSDHHVSNPHRPGYY